VSRTGNGKDGLATTMSWIILVVAGLLEVAWASVLPHTEGLTRPAPTAAFLALLAASMVALAKATETIPLGTAYGVWVGIGAVGAALVGIAAHGDPATPARLGFLLLLVAAIVGLKVTSPG
jgi:quaternary ammonium compound-resistance protein SugE